MSVEKDLVKQLRDAVALDWLIEAEGTLNNDTLTAAADEIERLRRYVDFLETLADGGPIMVNGMPWREMFARLNDLVSDPVTDASSSAS